MTQHILVVDDDALLRRSLAIALTAAGYRPSTVATGEEALALVERDPPDLVLLDINLPGQDGLATLRALHARQAVPVIFLTARRLELDQVLGLELGGDDYLTKPFDLDILLARIKAVLRRSGHPAHAPGGTPIQCGDLRIDPQTYTVSRGQDALHLGPREFALLYTLASHPGEVVRLNALIRQVWGPDYTGDVQVIYVHMRWLREKLEADPNHPTRLITIRGVGYKLVPQEVPCS